MDAKNARNRASSIKRLSTRPFGQPLKALIRHGCLLLVPKRGSLVNCKWMYKNERSPVAHLLPHTHAQTNHGAVSDTVYRRSSFPVRCSTPNIKQPASKNEYCITNHCNTGRSRVRHSTSSFRSVPVCVANADRQIKLS